MLISFKRHPLGSIQNNIWTLSGSLWHMKLTIMQHYLQQLEHESILDIHQQMNGWRSCTFIQYNGILLSHKMECIWVSSNEVDEPRAYYTKWSKSEREKQILHNNVYINTQPLTLLVHKENSGNSSIVDLAFTFDHVLHLPSSHFYYEDLVC